MMEAGKAMRAVPRIPGVEGIWVFIGADLCFFGLLFVNFMLGRREAPELYEAGRLTLDVNLGGLNTLLLLTSSWFVVRAVESARAGRLAAVRPWLLAALACGAAFGLVKAVEYGHKLAVGITPATSEFYMYYFVLTGFHMAHVIAGSVVLLVLWRQAGEHAAGGPRMIVMECGATYWHMVDLLWIFLFPLLYLMR